MRRQDSRVCSSRAKRREAVIYYAAYGSVAFKGEEAKQVK